MPDIILLGRVNAADTTDQIKSDIARPQQVLDGEYYRCSAEEGKVQGGRVIVN